LFFGLVFSFLLFLPVLTVESGSKPDLMKERGIGGSLMRERGQSGKLNHKGIEIPAYNGNGVPLSPEQGKMILTIIDDFLVNDTINADQFGPAVATDGSGNFVITWYDFRNGMFNPDIYAQRYNSPTIPQGANFKVNDDPETAFQRDPAIAIDSSDNFVITWYDYRNGNWDIYAQRYGSSGKSLGKNYLVTNPLYVSYDQLIPAVGLSSSHVYFIWKDKRNGNPDIYAKVVDWAWPYTCGDANGDVSVTVSDVVYLINYPFRGGPPPQCQPAPYLTCGDANDDGKVTVSDVVYLINYLFKGGPQPCI
jgi:hypothetical protein